MTTRIAKFDPATLKATVSSRGKVKKARLLASTQIGDLPCSFFMYEPPHAGYKLMADPENVIGQHTAQLATRFAHHENSAEGFYRVPDPGQLQAFRDACGLMKDAIAAMEK